MNARLHKTRRALTCATFGATLSMLYTLAGPAAAAVLYQWTDEQGVVHFTDKPPQGKNATKMRVKGPATSGTEEQAATDEGAKPDPNAERCETERKRLQVLQSNMTVRMRNDDGSMRKLTTEEMQEEMAFSEAAIKRFCKAATQD